MQLLNHVSVKVVRNGDRAPKALIPKSMLLGVIVLPVLPSRPTPALSLAFKKKKKKSPK